jgi:hypothetical protein
VYRTPVFERHRPALPCLAFVIISGQDRVIRPEGNVMKIEQRKEIIASRRHGNRRPDPKTPKLETTTRNGRVYFRP